MKSETKSTSFQNQSQSGNDEFDELLKKIRQAHEMLNAYGQLRRAMARLVAECAQNGLHSVPSEMLMHELLVFDRARKRIIGE